MKKYLLLFFLLIVSIFTISNTHANDLIFLGDQGSTWFSSQEKESIKKSIDSIQKTYGLNMDVIILGPNDEKGCYRQTSIDMCVKENYFLASDLIVVIKMKSAQSNRGDIRSLIKDDIKTIISTSYLKSIQDEITIYFKQSKFEGGILAYNTKLSSKIYHSCGKQRDCNIFSLAQNKVSRQNKKIQTTYLLIIGGILSIVLLYIIMRKYYVKQMRKLLDDIIYRESTIDEKKLFADSKKTYKKRYKQLKEIIETYLADSSKGILKSQSYFKKTNIQLKEIDTQLLEEQVNYTSQRDIAHKIDDLKDINI